MSFPVDRNVIKRDGIFLILANFILIFIIRQKQLDVKDGLTLIILYLLYLFFLRKGFGQNNDTFEENVHVIPDKELKFSDIIKIDLKKILLGGKLMTTTLAWKVLIISTVVMSLGTWLLVEGTELLGRKEYSIFGIDGLQGLGVPLIFLSVVFASAATSIPDTMISIRDARKNNHIDSISNAIGSNIFDISFALGLPLFLYTVIYRPVVMSEEVRVWSLSVWLVLFIINLIVIPVFIQSKKFGRAKGMILLLLYIAFIFFIIEENTRLSWVSGIVKGLLE